MGPQDIQDSNPYSRNLILISLAIIIFNFADGEIMNDHLKLHVINIKFNNVEFFSNFIWLIFFWFIFRFWQSDKFKMNNIIFILKENEQYMSNKTLIKFVEKITNLKYRENGGFYGVWLNQDKIIPLDLNNLQLGKYSINIDKKSLEWKKVYISLLFEVCIKDIKALESYIPYLLALIAFISSIC
ncbi:hypothetical protein [Malaciobacter marinus]|uniref:hypothetical protein n=1 Tax=Malaciobacter marinus TaxID=505249 RepID=UPI003B0011BE